MSYLGCTFRIVAAIAIATALPFAAANICPNNSNEIRYDTVIIGGGGTGLFAGYYLKKFGYANFRILEATSEIGGRFREVRTFLPSNTLLLNQQSLSLTMRFLWLIISPNQKPKTIAASRIVVCG
jgi:heterodisulfide reductase subunit A-like polyferredoxin